MDRTVRHQNRLKLKRVIRFWILFTGFILLWKIWIHLTNDKVYSPHTRTAKLENNVSCYFWPRSLTTTVGRRIFTLELYPIRPRKLSTYTHSHNYTYTRSRCSFHPRKTNIHYRSRTRTLRTLRHAVDSVKRGPPVVWNVKFCVAHFFSIFFFFYFSAKSRRSFGRPTRRGQELFVLSGVDARPTSRRPLAFYRIRAKPDPPAVGARRRPKHPTLLP